MKFYTSTINGDPFFALQKANMGGITSGCVTYSFRFAENPSTELVKLTDFANRFCEQFMKKGFAMAFELGWGLNFFDYLYVKEHAHTRVV